MIIAFCGLDGSGKTSYSAFAAGYLKKKGKQVISRHIIRDSLYYSFLHDVIGRASRRGKESLEAGLRGKKRGAAFILTSALKMAALCSNLIWFDLVQFKYRGSRKRNIICDRYFYDDIAQASYIGLGGEAFLRFFSWFIKKPDILFFIEAKPAAAYTRKPEYQMDYFIKKAAIYSRLFSAIPNLKLCGDKMENNKKRVAEAIDGLFEEK